ncbi:ATP-binding protein, partial [Anoxybacillus rupiensis]|nr:ATP-binding protein [Anoxybacillus rupiensis]
PLFSLASKKMSQLTNVQEILRALHLTETASHLPILLKKAETEERTYVGFLHDVLRYEQQRREEKLRERRLKWASFPYYKTLDEFQLEEQPSLTKRQLQQLCELVWLDQLFNLILLGPPGVGKTHLAIGIGMEAIYQGYKVTFITMGELVHALKTEVIVCKETQHK